MCQVLSSPEEATLNKICPACMANSQPATHVAQRTRLSLRKYLNEMKKVKLSDIESYGMFFPPGAVSSMTYLC